MRTCRLRGRVRRAVQCDDRQATHLHSIRELEFGACGAYRAERVPHTFRLQPFAAVPATVRNYERA